jgi:hypothetical protein
MSLFNGCSTVAVRVSDLAKRGRALVADSRSRQIDIDLGFFRRIISMGVYPFHRYLKFPLHSPRKVKVHPS